MDTTVFDYDSRLFLFTYQDKKNDLCGYVYELDLEKFTVNLVKKIPYDINVGRGGGKIFYDGEKRIRPSQYSKNIYGENIVLNEILFDGIEYSEIPHNLMNKNDIKVLDENRIDRIHTYSRIGSYEAIDYSVNKFDLFKRFRICKRRMLKAKRKWKC